METTSLTSRRTIPNPIHLYPRWDRASMPQSVVNPGKQRRVDHAKVIRQAKDFRLQSDLGFALVAVVIRRNWWTVLCFSQEEAGGLECGNRGVIAKWTLEKIRQIGRGAGVGYS